MQAQRWPSRVGRGKGFSLTAARRCQPCPRHDLHFLAFRNVRYKYYLSPPANTGSSIIFPSDLTAAILKGLLMALLPLVLSALLGLGGTTTLMWR